MPETQKWYRDKMPNMIDTDDITRQVLRNCDISDAQNAGRYSICGLALRLRDLYKWEKGLPPWEENRAAEVLEWIGDKETGWEKIAEDTFRDISINGKGYSPFDTAGINDFLEGTGLFYGAGYGYNLKPTFFLARIREREVVDGFDVYFLGPELARDLMTAPALSQDGVVLVRADSAKRAVWDEITYIKKSGRPALHFALTACGVSDPKPESVQDHLGVIMETFRDIYVYHEIGEMTDSVFDTTLWREIVAAYPHSPVGLLARALKDLLADTGPAGTLFRIIQVRSTAALGFYAAFLDGLGREFFSELRIAFQQFVETKNWAIIREAADIGFRNARDAVETLVEIYETGKKCNDLGRAEKEIQAQFLTRIRKGH